MTIQSDSTRPSPASPAYDDIRALPPDFLLQRMRQGVEHFDRRVVELSREQVDQPWDPADGVGRWSIRTLCGHLADAEMVLAHRIRRTLAEDRPVLPYWDENAFIDSGLYGGPGEADMQPPLGAFLATIHTIRQMTVATLIQIPPEWWDRRAMHSEEGEQSVADIAAYACWHLEHHIAYCNAKVERLLGPAPAEEPCPESGCGKPGCTCHPQAD